MKNSDRMTESVFKKNPDGEGWLYFPNGIFSKGRVIKNIKTKEKIFNFRKNMDMYGKILGLLIFIISVKLDNLFIIAVYLLGLFLVEYFVIKELPVSNHKLKLSEVMSVIAKDLPSWFYKILYALSGILLALSISLPFIFKELHSVLLLVSLFGFGISVIGFIIGANLKKLIA